MSYNIYAESNKILCYVYARFFGIDLAQINDKTLCLSNLTIETFRLRNLYKACEHKTKDCARFQCKWTCQH